MRDVQQFNLQSHKAYLLGLCTQSTNFCQHYSCCRRDHGRVGIVKGTILLIVTGYGQPLVIACRTRLAVLRGCISWMAPSLVTCQKAALHMKMSQVTLGSIDVEHKNKNENVMHTFVFVHNSSTSCNAHDVATLWYKCRCTAHDTATLKCSCRCTARCTDTLLC